MYQCINSIVMVHSELVELSIGKLLDTYIVKLNF